MPYTIQGEYEATLTDTSARQNVQSVPVQTDPWTLAYQAEFGSTEQSSAELKLCGDYTYNMRVVGYGTDDTATYEDISSLASMQT